jgi:hypothetical protein
MAEEHVPAIVADSPSSAPLHITSRPPVVHLGADGFEAFARDAAGPALLAADEAALPQLAEDVEGAVLQPPAVAGDAVHRDDVATVVLVLVDAPGLREGVQRALLVFRDVHMGYRL